MQVSYKIEISGYGARKYICYIDAVPTLAIGRVSSDVESSFMLNRHSKVKINMTLRHPVPAHLLKIYE